MPTSFDNFIALAQRRARYAFSFFRLRPYETNDEAGRSKERYRRAALSGTASLAVKGSSILANLIVIPISLHYLGVEQYGLWMTIASFAAMLTFADLGLGNGLINAISEASGIDDTEAARRSVSSAFFMLVGIALLVTVAFVAAYGYVPWPKVFNVSSPRAVAEAGISMAAFFGCFVADIPLGVTHKVHMGYQEGFIYSLWTVLGNAMGLIFVLLAIHEDAGLPWLVLSVAGSPVLAKTMNGLYLFGIHRPSLRPAWRAVNRATARKLLSIGTLFLVLQVAGALTVASDNIVATQVIGPAAVTQYAIPYKLLNFAPLLLTFFALPLWPAYGEAIARGDIGWIRRTLRRSLSLTLAAVAPVSLLLIIFGKQVIRFWVGPQIHPSTLLLAGLGIWALICSAGSTLSMFWNGANVIGFQIVFATLIGVGALLAKILLARWIGVPGIIWGDIAAYMVFAPAPTILYLPKVLSRLERRATERAVQGGLLQPR